MTASIQTVRLCGVLGKRFGYRHQLAINTAAEAVHALCQMLKGFEAFLTEAKGKGLTFAVFVDGRNVPRDELVYPCAKEVKLVPIAIGAKSGGLMTIFGAILIIVGVLFIWTPFGAPLIGVGAGLMAGGIAMMLAPQPKDPKAEDDPDKRSSYAFNGPVNTQAQGNPVPLLYGGPLYIGSAVISASIDVTEGAYVPAGSTTGTGSPPPSGGGSSLSHAIAQAKYAAENP